MWGPCFGHKRAMFWPFLWKGAYGIHPELWNLAWSVLGNIDYDSRRTNLKDHVRTAVHLWSCFIEEASSVLLKSWFFFWLIDIKYQVATNYCWYWLSYHLHRKCPKLLEIIKWICWYCESQYQTKLRMMLVLALGVTLFDRVNIMQSWSRSWAPNRHVCICSWV